MEWLSVPKYAKSRGVTRQAIEKHVKSGKIGKDAIKLKKPGGKQILINPELADRALNRNVEHAEYSGVAVSDKKEQQPDGQPSLNDIKKVYWAEKAKKERRQNEIASGEYVRLSDVQNESFLIAREIRDALLNLKYRISDEIAAVSKVRSKVVEKIIDNEVNSILEVLSK